MSCTHHFVIKETLVIRPLLPQQPICLQVSVWFICKEQHVTESIN